MIDKNEYRKTLVRYGVIVEDESFVNDGNHVRETVFKLNGKHYHVVMKNGNVESIIEK